MVTQPDNFGCEVIQMAAAPKRPLTLSANQAPEDTTSQWHRDLIGPPIRLEFPLADLSIAQLREIAKSMQEAWAQVEALTLRDSTVQAKDWQRETRHVMVEVRAILNHTMRKHLPKRRGGRPKKS